MPRKVLRWFALALRQISPAEICLCAINISALILFGYEPRFLYPWAIIALCDLLALGAHGAWLYGGGDCVFGPWHNGAILPLFIRCIAFLLLLTTNVRPENAVLNICFWYVVVITSICYAFYGILLTMHEYNHTWLDGTRGHVGVPNWISISRMALSILVPHVFATQSLGPDSNTIATITLAVAISTDAIDGFCARRLNQITKIGKVLDPLGDKVIFYPTAVAFIVATNGTFYLEAPTLQVAFFVTMAIMLARDICFILWFALFYSKLKNGIGASIVDKIRMVFMCIWLGACAPMLTFTDFRAALSLVSFVCIAIVAILSIASIVVDLRRVQPLIRDNS